MEMSQGVTGYHRMSQGPFDNNIMYRTHNRAERFCLVKKERGNQMDFDIKTVSFGGYDKKATETYIAEQQKKYEDEIAKLKEDATKLSEAVKGLQQMREANMTESKSTIDNLKLANEDMQREIARLNEELEGFRNRESEPASRYESISRTLLAARENADSLTRKTNEECERKTAETNAQCQAMIEETNARCEQLKNATDTECDRLMSQTQSSCQEQKETTYAECENLRRRTKEETDQLSQDTQLRCNMLTRETQERCDALTRETQERCDNLNAQTEAACARLKEDTISECDKLKADTRDEIRMNRALVKREFDSIGGFMTQLQTALSDVNAAVDETKRITDSAFSDLVDSSSQTETSSQYESENSSQEESSSIVYKTESSYQSDDE